MKSILTGPIIAAGLIVSMGCFENASGAIGAADGLIRFEPPQAASCIAVRVEVPQDKMITGLRWYNGTSVERFPQILVASGNDFAPPGLEQAVTVAKDVRGQDQAWSEVDFSSAVASQSGTLFVVMRYPANYAPEVGQPALGVGYATGDSPRRYFVSGDGEQWMGVTDNCRVLLEPILADRTPGVTEKRGTGGLPQPEVRLGLFAAPNPFNPQTKIELGLAAATTGVVRIVDVRGFVVAELYRGALNKGTNAFVWTAVMATGGPRPAACTGCWPRPVTRSWSARCYWSNSSRGRQTWDVTSGSC